MTDETPEAGDEFNPREYPETFTPALVRKMRLRELITIEQHSDELSPEQQRSFTEAKAEVLGPALEAIKGSIGSKWAGPRAMQLLSPEVLASFNTINTRLSQQRRLASRIQPDIKFTRDVTIFPPPATATAGAHPPVISTSEDDELEESTVAEFEREVDRDTEMLTVLRSMATMMEDEKLSVTRGKFFAVIVSMAVIVAGVAPIVAASDWCERFWIIGISAALGLLAFGAYRFVLRKQSK